MTEKMTIAIQDPDFEDEDLQELVQNFLWEIREFDGVEDARLLMQDNDTWGSKGVGAFVLGTFTVTLAVRAISEITTFMEERWLKPKENLRSLSIQMNVLGSGETISCNIKNSENLRAFQDVISKRVSEN